MSEWKETKLEDLGTVVGGATPSTKDSSNYENGKIAWITPKDLSTFNGRFISYGERNITEKGLKSCSAQIMPKNSVLFTSRAPIGYIAIANNELCTNQGFKSIIPNEKTDYLFLYYLLKFNTDMIERMGSGTTFKEVSKKTMEQIKVHVPVDLAEQKRIAKILGSLDDKIELNNKINRNLEEQAQALFKNWFVDFEPFGGVMPEEWKEESLADLCGSISKVHKFDKKDLIFLNTGDVDHGQYLHRTYSLVKDMPGQAKKSIQKNDILYSEIRPANGHYAYVNFNAEDYVVSTKLMVIRAKEISSYRLYNYLTNPDVIAELQTEADARSGTFPQIRFENIQRLSMVIGSKEVETRFSKLLENLYKQIFANIEENQKLIDLRDTLLPKLMSEEEI